ncbi:MAG: DUF2786 domain-containing protein [Proteobacteria bacterium]|nr:DUF2786 domain-containing protein [Pseudomonadota bacterium]
MVDAAVAAQIEAAFVREIRRCYDFENRRRFGSKLRAPVIVLSGATARLGRWVPATRTLELARALVMQKAWIDIAGVLEHEMAHQFVDVVLGVRDETAHGESFRTVCAARGIDHRAAGDATPAGTAELDSDATTRVFDRIRKLLALAGSDNEHEAELAMQKAHALMLRHNVDQVRERVAHGFEVRLFGEAHRRGNPVEADVICLLTEFFFVEAIRVPVYLPMERVHGWIYEIVGTHANVEMAAHVHAFLLATAERLWQVNRVDARVRSGRDRRSYQAGVVAGFREKLVAERTTLTTSEPGLVWVGDDRLDAFYRARHPNIVRRKRRFLLTGAHAAGREAGRTVVIHKPVTSSSTPAGGPRLLR